MVQSAVVEKNSYISRGPGVGGTGEGVGVGVGWGVVYALLLSRQHCPLPGVFQPRPLGRSAIKQKGKWRCIDNGKSSGHNAATTMNERITCGRADFPAVMAREFARRARKHGRRPPRMQHGTDDLEAAFRRAPTSQPEYTVVAVWDSDLSRIVFTSGSRRTRISDGTKIELHEK